MWGAGRVIGSIDSGMQIGFNKEAHRYAICHRNKINVITSTWWNPCCTQVSVYVSTRRVLATLAPRDALAASSSCRVNPPSSRSSTTMTSHHPPSRARVHIVRHGEALHNVERDYPFRDPPLTEAGSKATKEIALPSHPDIVVISPMTRTCQTAMNLFPFLQDVASSPIPTQIWPDLREANDAICNKGLARADMQANFPQFDFSECEENWDYPSHDVADATERAERVRQRLRHLSTTFENIAVISHRGFIAYLVQGRRFHPAESRSYRFASDAETRAGTNRRGVHCDLLQEHDFGPTLLLFHSKVDVEETFAASNATLLT